MTEASSGASRLVREPGERPAIDAESFESLQREVERLRILASKDRGVLNAILEHSPHGIIVSDVTGRLILQNRAAERIWAGSASASDVEGWGQYRAFHPDGRAFEAGDWPMAKSLRERVVTDAQEFHILRFDGTHAFLVGSTAPIFDSAGELEGAISVFADVTRLRESEAQARRLEQDLSEKLRELEGLAERTALLQGVTSALAAASTVQEVAEVVTSRGATLFGATASLLFRIAEDGRRLELLSLSGVDTSRAASYRTIALDGHEPLARAVRSGEPVWLGSREEILARHPELAAVRLGDAALAGVVALPIRDEREVIGGLAFSFYSPPRLDAVRRDFFLTVAAQCGLALGRARYYEAERRAKERLERQNARMAVLAQASETLSSSLDSRKALAELTNLVVPTLADWCAIDELHGSGEIRRVAVHHRDPAKVALAEELHQKYPPRADAEHGVPRVLRTGEMEFAPDIPDEVLVAVAQDEEHLRLARSLQLTSFAVVPLKARGRVLGALSLVSEGARRLVDEDVQFAQELARRAALALENARLFEEVARREARLRALVDATAAVVWTATATGEVVEPSPSWLAFTGQSEAEYLNGGFEDAIHPDDRESTLRTWRDTIAAGAPYACEYRLRRADGSFADTLARGMPVRAADGTVLEYVGCNLDVTELRRAEALAREHAETLGTVNELGKLIAAELDAQTVVQAVTDAVTELTGAQFGAFFYNTIDERGARYLLHTISGVPREHFSKFPTPRNTAVFAPTFAGEGIVRSADITQDPRYGKNPPYHGMPEGHLPVRSYLAVPVISRSGEVIGGIFLGHGSPNVFGDRAEALASGIAAQAAVAMDNARLFGDAQRLIRALEATNRELDQFAYVTSHDLKAPLRGIGSLAEWIEEDLGATMTEDVRRKLDLLRGRVRRMEALIQGILDYSRALRWAGRREDVDVQRLVGDIVELLAPKPPAAVRAEPGLPVLHTERVALQQVLMNLIGNGLKHAGRPDAEVRVTARDAGEHWEFRVTDNGPGIAEQYHERIWGIFQTLEARDKVENTGIGLAIVKKIVEAHEGRVWIESEEGQGATFGFTWPKREDRSK